VYFEVETLLFGTSVSGTLLMTLRSFILLHGFLFLMQPKIFVKVSFSYILFGTTLKPFLILRGVFGLKEKI